MYYYSNSNKYTMSIIFWHNKCNNFTVHRGVLLVITKLCFLSHSSMKFCPQITEIFLNAFLKESQVKLSKKTIRKLTFENGNNIILFSLVNSALKCHHKSRFHSLVEKYLCILLVLGCPYNQLLVGREKQMQKISLSWECSYKTEMK